MTSTPKAFFAGFGVYTILKYRLDKRFILNHAALALVSVGSWCFHMTLLYEFQLLDELPSKYYLSNASE